MGAQPIRVLVCDDDEALVTTLEWFLAQADFEVVSATSGRQALDILAHQAIDLLLLDLMMPQMSGQEVLRQVRANARTQRLPVVILTAVDDSQARDECQQLRASEYLIKPIEVGALRKVLQRALTGQIMAGAASPSQGQVAHRDGEATESGRRAVRAFVMEVSDALHHLRKQVTLGLAREPQSRVLKSADEKCAKLEALLKELETTATSQ